jgi:dimethylaniline monooxygenase (N-oxide forming)
MIINSLCIIGFGVSGIATCRWAKEYGFIPTVFEKNKTFGGCWYTSTYPGCKLQTNKYSYTFSDMPMPEEYPLYPSGKQVYLYLKNYIKYHNLGQYTKYNSDVQSIKMIDNMWHVLVNNQEYIFKYLIIATGFYRIKNSRINGSILPNEINSKNSTNIFNNKKIVIVGNGPSGCDISCLAVLNKAKSVTLLYRSPKWVVPRIVCGKSTHIGIWRVYLLLGNKYPTWLYRLVLILYLYFADKLFDFDLPPNKITRNNLTVNEIIYDYIRSGKIIYKKEPLVYVNNNIVTTAYNNYNFDVLVDCTGFDTGIPLLGYNNMIPKTYNNIITPGINNMGIIGFAATPNWAQVSDLQARWLLNVFKNNIQIPDKKEQIMVINKRKNEDYHDLAYDMYNYCDTLYYDICKKKKNSIRNYFETPGYNFYKT